MRSCRCGDEVNVCVCQDTKLALAEPRLATRNFNRGHRTGPAMAPPRDHINKYPEFGQIWGY
jgi:hypothetical protein